VVAACALAVAPYPAVAGRRPTDAATPPGALQHAFSSAAREFHVPESVLLAVSYNESLWESHTGSSTSGGYGVMHLVDLGHDSSGGPAALPVAAALLGAPAEQLRTDPVRNVRGAAALLARYERESMGALPSDAGLWYAAVARYSGSPDVTGARVFADDVYRTIRTGAARTTAAGQAVRLAGDPAVRPDTAAIGRLHLQDSQPEPAECPEDLDCDPVPAAHAQASPTDTVTYGNYDTADRPGDGNTIRTIVIHDTELPYDATLQAFQNPATGGSSHYVVRSSDGHVTQMVPTRDVAWHAGNWYVNAHAIGIEHEGFAVEGATWYTEVLYRSSARLVRYLARRFDIPLDREHIIGHDEVPGPTQDQVAGMHWDPGPFWDWDHYMELLGAPMGAPLGAREAVTSGARHLPEPGATVVISPGFAGNTPPVTSCDPSGCEQLPAQPSNFVALHTAPSPDAPLLSEPALHPDGSPGTTKINDWGDTAVTGQSFVVAGQDGDWTGIWYGGREAWFENPGAALTATVHRDLTVTPREDAPVAVYGRAYPEAGAFPPEIPSQTVTPLDATIQPGQAYVAEAPVASDYYRFRTVDGSAPGDGTLVRGQTRYYPIEFNHRRAFVKVDDVRPARRGD